MKHILKSRRRANLKLRPGSYRPRLEFLEARTLLSTYTVDRLTDTGDGSGSMGDLRYCITNAMSGDTITFADGRPGTIRLTRALPALTRSISIEGPGAALMTVRRDTGGDYRIFTVATSTMVNIDGLTIANGDIYYGDDHGGGIFNSGTLTLTHSAVSGNSASVYEGQGAAAASTMSER
jgi:hypothetical protein